MMKSSSETIPLAEPKPLMDCFIQIEALNLKDSLVKSDAAQWLRVWVTNKCFRYTFTEQTCQNDVELIPESFYLLQTQI